MLRHMGNHSCKDVHISDKLKKEKVYKNSYIWWWQSDNFWDWRLQKKNLNEIDKIILNYNFEISIQKRKSGILW